MLTLRSHDRRKLYAILVSAIVLLGLLGAAFLYWHSEIAPQHTTGQSTQTANAAPVSPAPAQSATPSDGTHDDPSKISVLINKKHPFKPLNFVPSDLVSYGGYLVSAKMEPYMDAMFKAAAAAGVPISLSSTYRSYDNQVVVYNHWTQVNGSADAADTVSARPGYSEHQTGFAMDLEVNSSCTLECFAGSAQYKWLQQHAADYGFIERYPKGLESITGYSAEAWHWRYVGKAVAQQMKQQGIKTLEQFWNITGGDY